MQQVHTQAPHTSKVLAHAAAEGVCRLRRRLRRRLALTPPHSLAPQSHSVGAAISGAAAIVHISNGIACAGEMRQYKTKVTRVEGHEPRLASPNLPSGQARSAGCVGLLAKASCQLALRQC